MAQERKRRRFTAEYKAEAVKRLEESGKALQQVAAELGVHANQLRTWRNERLAAGSAEALARQKAEAAELARLKREVNARCGRFALRSGATLFVNEFYKDEAYSYEVCDVRGKLCF